MNSNLTKYLDANRETNSSFHLRIAREWRIYGELQKLHNPLAYAAFEYRIAIERFLFEFYFMIRLDKNFNDKDAKKASSLKKLIITICHEVGSKEILHKRIKFNRIVAENSIVNGNYLRGKYLPSIFNIDTLNNYWVKLSSYCHRQLKPNITWESMGNDWVNKGYELLNEVENYLFEIKVTNSPGWFSDDNLQIEMKETLNEYINGKIDDNKLKIRIELLRPLFEMRNRF